LGGGAIDLPKISDLKDKSAERKKKKHPKTTILIFDLRLDDDN
jgi:hypothetical protein